MLDRGALITQMAKAFAGEDVMVAYLLEVTRKGVER